jgi:hypothetical protein
MKLAPKSEDVIYSLPNMLQKIATEIPLGFPAAPIQKNSLEYKNWENELQIYITVQRQGTKPRFSNKNFSCVFFNKFSLGIFYWDNPKYVAQLLHVLQFPSDYVNHIQIHGFTGIHLLELLDESLDYLVAKKPSVPLSTSASSSSLGSSSSQSPSPSSLSPSPSSPSLSPSSPSIDVSGPSAPVARKRTNGFGATERNKNKLTEKEEMEKKDEKKKEKEEEKKKEKEEKKLTKLGKMWVGLNPAFTSILAEFVRELAITQST